jgi:CheY-like chemotaxis protein
MTANRKGSGDRVRRVLVVDDNPAIRDDFMRILCPSGPSHRKLKALEASLFGDKEVVEAPVGGFLVDAASQGREALDAVVRMAREGAPYALAFIDMRMPPGWDGAETAARIRQADPAIQIVICSAYSDYSWHEVIKRVQRPDLRFLQKPFEAKDALELAYSLTSKWLQSRSKMA